TLRSCWCGAGGAGGAGGAVGAVGAVRTSGLRRAAVRQVSAVQAAGGRGYAAVSPRSMPSPRSNGSPSPRRFQGRCTSGFQCELDPGGGRRATRETGEAGETASTRKSLTAGACRLDEGRCRWQRTQPNSAVSRLIVVWQKQSVGPKLAAPSVESHPRAPNDVAPPSCRSLPARARSQAHNTRLARFDRCHDAFRLPSARRQAVMNQVSSTAGRRSFLRSSTHQALAANVSCQCTLSKNHNSTLTQTSAVGPSLHPKPQLVTLFMLHSENAGHGHVPVLKDMTPAHQPSEVLSQLQTLPRRRRMLSEVSTMNNLTAPKSPVETHLACTLRVSLILTPSTLPQVTDGGIITGTFQLILLLRPGQQARRHLLLATARVTTRAHRGLQARSVSLLDLHEQQPGDRYIYNLTASMEQPSHPDPQTSHAPAPRNLLFPRPPLQASTADHTYHLNTQQTFIHRSPQSHHRPVHSQHPFSQLQLGRAGIVQHPSHPQHSLRSRLTSSSDSAICACHAMGS
ncbi:hypothetical protein SVAN01_07556, partial [Stagonosporopsis vannaccii]